MDAGTFEPEERVLTNLRGFLEKYILDSFFNGAAHGFKFASLVGKILSELAIHGKTQYPIEAFRVDRPALTDPAYEPAFAM